MPNLCVFGLEFENIFVMFQISDLEFVLLQSLVQKQKWVKTDQKWVIRVFLSWNLKENIVIFEISTLDLV